jgi:hypothetical protein
MPAARPAGAPGKDGVADVPAQEGKVVSGSARAPCRPSARLSRTLNRTPAARLEITLSDQDRSTQHEHEHHVPLGSEARGIPGDHSPPVRPCRCRNQRILGRLQADLRNVDLVTAVAVTAAAHVVSQALPRANQTVAAAR